MKRSTLKTLAVMLCSISSMAASAYGSFPRLREYAFNIDGAVSNITVGNAVPPNVDLSLFDSATGLGQVTVNFSAPGTHSVLFFVDHDIDAPVNAFNNEAGESLGTPTSGQTWEIDEPGYASAYLGDIYTNFSNGALDNSVFNTAFGPPFIGSAPEDVSMAMGLTVGGPGSVVYNLSATDPGSGFRLRHLDPDSPGSIYFSASVHSVPEPGSFLLWSVALGGVFALRRWRKRKQSAC